VFGSSGGLQHGADNTAIQRQRDKVHARCGRKRCLFAVR
jgi:hypothetical protein